MMEERRKRLTRRVVRAARLDGSLYAEVKTDTAATAQALAVVTIVALAHGLGGAIRGAYFGWNPVSGSLFGVVGEITFFVVASLVIYLLARYVFGAMMTYPQVLRPFGFSVLPGLLILIATLASLAEIGAEVPVFVVLSVWRLAAGFVAVRQVSGLGFVNSAGVLSAGVTSGVLAVALTTRSLAAALNWWEIGS